MNWRLVTCLVPLGLLASGVVLAFELPTDSERENAVGSLAVLDASLQRVFRNEGEIGAAK